LGESVSNVSGVIDIFPIPRKRYFLRAGGGFSQYSINRPAGTNGSGPGWEVGGGYEAPLRGNLRIVPMVEYASGRLGNGSNSATAMNGLRFSVVEFKIAALFRFGKSGR
jgi:hypothetical protein